MENKNVQQLIKEFASLDKKDKKLVLDKQQEILHELIKNEYIYTLLDKSTTSEQLKSNKVAILTSANSVGRPCFRIFSEKTLAENCARKYNLTIDTDEEKDVPLIFKVTTKGMIKTAYSAMFNGLYDIVIDDGAAWINVNAKDFVNSLYSYVGEDDIVSDADFTFINIVNMLKYTDRPVFTVNNVENEDGSKKIQIFIEKKDADKYALDKLNNVSLVQSLNVMKLNDLIVENFEKTPQIEISIVFGTIIRKMKIAKANFILNKML